MEDAVYLLTGRKQAVFPWRFSSQQVGAGKKVSENLRIGVIASTTLVALLRPSREHFEGNAVIAHCSVQKLLLREGGLHEKAEESRDRRGCTSGWLDWGSPS